MKKMVWLAVAIVGMSIPSAEAQQCGNRHVRPNRHSHWNVNRSQFNQQSRIWQGVRSGSITAQEARQLQARQRQIASLESRLRVGGLTPSERLRLNKQLSQLNRQIYRQANDNQVRI